ncbi:MAG: TetR/AcrR family transcriptional regulator [Halobacteriota archaeon]
MSDSGGPDTDSATEIMDATYRALCSHGFTALTMQDIADECDKSKSLLHYHYDTKEELLVSFLSHLFDDFEARVDEIASLPPEEQLMECIGWFVFGSDDDERVQFHVALLEFRSQAPFNDRYRAQLQRSDDILRGTFERILTEGIEVGVFRSVDVDATARLLVAAIDGARTRQITLDDNEYTNTVRTGIVTHIVEPLVTDAATLPGGTDSDGDASE